jgi:hypothetical protein
MIRALLLLVAGLFIAILLYALLFTGGHSRGGSFGLGAIRVAYEINAPGALRAERLEYVVLSEDEPQAESVHSSNGISATIARTYIDAGKTNTISFSTKPGQTVWIGKDRSVRVTSVPLSLKDIKLIEQHKGDAALQSIRSLEELTKVLAALSAEPDAAPNAASPHR